MKCHWGVIFFNAAASPYGICFIPESLEWFSQTNIKHHGDERGGISCFYHLVETTFFPPSGIKGMSKLERRRGVSGSEKIYTKKFWDLSSNKPIIPFSFSQDFLCRSCQDEEPDQEILYRKGTQDLNGNSKIKEVSILKSSQHWGSRWDRCSGCFIFIFIFLTSDFSRAHRKSWHMFLFVFGL